MRISQQIGIDILLSAVTSENAAGCFDSIIKRGGIGRPIGVLRRLEGLATWLGKDYMDNIHFLHKSQQNPRFGIYGRI